MQELDFELDGAWASNKGITLCRPVSFSAAVPRTQAITIPGRNGALHIDEGAFNVRTASVSCYALSAANVVSSMGEIMAFLFGNGFGIQDYRKLTSSDDTGYFWYARIVNAGEIAARLGKLNPFTIEWECKPFRYVVGSDTQETVASKTFTNPTQFPSYPLIYVNSSGGGTISVTSGAQTTGTITISSGSPGGFYIDCEEMRAYSGNTSYDQYITCDEFPWMPLGQSHFEITGGLAVTAAPRWRTL